MSNFANEKKWCGTCRAYQSYLLSVNHSFCASCGAPVVLFSKDDKAKLGEALSSRRGHQN